MNIEKTGLAVYIFTLIIKECMQDAKVKGVGTIYYPIDPVYNMRIQYNKLG